MRRLYRAVLGFLLLGAMAFAVVLFRGHLEIRAIAPPLPDPLALRTALATDAGPTRLHSINTASQRVPTQPTMSYPAFVLEWPDGRRFVIDAGMEAEAALAFGEPLEWMTGADPIQPHGSLGEQMGERGRTVAGMGFTHMHTDHTGGLRTLCPLRNQDLTVFQIPLQADIQNHTTDPGLALLGDSGCVRFERLGPGPIHSIPGFPGLVAVAVGGHTPGSTVFLAQVKNRTWVFSGDITNTREALVIDRPKPILYSLLIVPENRPRLDALRAWLRKLDDSADTTVVVSHDLGAASPPGDPSALPAWH